MKKAKFLGLVLLLIASIALVFSGCGGNNAGEDGKINFKGPKVNVTENGSSEYVIIRNKNGTDYETDVAVDLRSKIETITGVGLKLSHDQKDENAHEILIGSARGANEGLKANEYRVQYKDGDIIITGGSDKALKKAYDFFMFQFLDCNWETPVEELVKTDVLKIPEKLEYNDSYLTREEQLQMTVLTKYPEYPEYAMPRDFDYTVRVTQGENTIEIPVYDPVFATDYFNSGVNDFDMHRRYAEFAFSGDPVTIEITVNRDFKSYSIMPSSRQIPSQINGNTITYTIDKPQTTVFKINEDRDTMLTIFAEEPEIEEDIPDKNSKSVIYFEPGYHEVENGILHVEANTTVYLAPGALVKSRVHIKGSNVTIAGNGAFIESSPTRMAVDSVRYMFNVSGSDINVKNVKVLDSHDFNFVTWGGSNIELDGVKFLANQISTDGITIAGGSENIHCVNCYWGVSDNVFVIGGGAIKNFVVEDCIVASDYATFFPQGDLTGGTLTFRNIDVLRCSTFLKETYPSDKTNKHADILFENIYAVDVEKACTFIQMSDLGSLAKTYVMKNVSAPSAAGVQLPITLSENTGGVNFTADNVWVGTTQFNSLDAVKNNVDVSKNTFKFESTSNKDAVFVGKKNVVKLDTPYVAEKIYIGGLRVDTMYVPYNENGTMMVCVNEILKQLSFEDINFDGTKLTFKYGDEVYEATAGSTKAVSKGNEVTLSVAPVAKEQRLMVPMSFFSEVLGTQANYDQSIKKLLITNIDRGGNLLRNPGFESGLSMDWVTRFFTSLYLSNDAHSGNYSIRCYRGADSYMSSTNVDGIYQDVIDVFRKYGKGQYKITAWVKKADSSCNSTYIMAGLATGYNLDSSKASKIALTNQWKQIEYTYTLSTDPEKMDGAFLCIGYADGSNKNYLIDDICMEKIR